MICQGKFIYKGIHKKDGGSFTNQTGQVINWKESFEVKFDEVKDGVCTERKMKIPIEETELIGKFSNISIYKEVILDFDISFNSKGLAGKIVDVHLPSKNKQTED